MSDVVIQYVFIIILVVGLGYLAYVLKDKGVNIKDDYFGLTYVILSKLNQEEFTTENVKSILRIISNAVKYIESNYKNDENEFKEEEALKMIKETLKGFNFASRIDDESIRYIIRIAASMLPQTHNSNEGEVKNIESDMEE